MNADPVQPPQWPRKLLRLILRREYQEEIEGDMAETFVDNLQVLTPAQARRRYVFEAFHLLRLNLIRVPTLPSNVLHTAMFTNYLKISWRGLVKHPVNSFINVIGLSMALGIFVFAFAFTRWTLSTDQFHENRDEVFLITSYANRDGQPQSFGVSPRPLAAMIKNDFPSVSATCPVDDRSVVVRHRDAVFHETVRFTDPDFLTMFTFPLKWGCKQHHSQRTYVGEIFRRAESPR